MSKVLISSSSRYSIYKVQIRSRSPTGSLELLYLNTTKSLCQELFSSFFKLFQLRTSFSVVSGRSRLRLAYTIICLTICQALILSFLTKNSGASFEAPESDSQIIRHRRSGHSRHHFCDRQQRRNRRYPHHGTQRSYAPAGSSAGQPLLWSWV